MLDTILLALLLAQLPADPTSASSWLDTVAKVGLGVASFAALVGGGYIFLRALLAELKESRVSFLAALERLEVSHTAENNLVAQGHERQTDRILDRIDSLACAQPENGRDRNSRGGGGSSR